VGLHFKNWTHTKWGNRKCWKIRVVIVLHFENWTHTKWWDKERWKISIASIPLVTTYPKPKPITIASFGFVLKHNMSTTTLPPSQSKHNPSIGEIHHEIKTTDLQTKSTTLQKPTYLSSIQDINMSWASFSSSIFLHKWINNHVTFVSLMIQHRFFSSSWTNFNDSTPFFYHEWLFD